MPSTLSTEQKREQNRAAKRRYYARNRAAIIEKSRKYHEAHPEQRKISARKSQMKNNTPEIAYKSNLKYKYGITLAEYGNLFQAQGGCCAICLTHQSNFKRKLYVDHDHSTGTIRGLLCHNCNSVLGHARDDLNVLNAAISYLEKHRGE